MCLTSVPTPPPTSLRSHPGLWESGNCADKNLVPSSYLVMPFMQTDLQKIMGMEFSEDKVQYLVYQMLKGLKVGGVCTVAKGDLGVESQPTAVGQRKVLDAGVESDAPDSPLSLSVHPLSWYRPQGEYSLCLSSGECVLE